MAVVKTIAHYDTTTITAVKSFIIQATRMTNSYIYIGDV